MKRLIFLDSLRGAFILYVLLVHAVGNIVFGADLGAINDVSPFVVLILFPLILLGTWAPIFAFISGTANVYVFYNLMDKDPSDAALKKIIKGNLINNTIILIISYVNMAFFHPSVDFNGGRQYSILTGLLETGNLQFTPDILFYTDAMHIIAMSGFFISAMLYFLWRNGGFERRRRNVFVMTGVAILILFVTPVMREWLLPIFYSELSAGHYFSALILKTFVGPRQSTFPNVANALIGAVVGISLAQNSMKQDIKEYTISLALLFLSIDFLLVIPQNGIALGDITRNDLPATIYLINTALQLLVFTLLIVKIEYRDHETRQKIAKRSVGIRRFGIMALSIYIFEGIVSIGISKLYIPLWGPDFVLSENLVAIILFIVVDVGIWYLLLRLWEKWDFKYSLEWWIVTIVGKLRGRKSSRLKVNEVLYNPVNIPSEELEESILPLFPAETFDKTDLGRLIERFEKILKTFQRELDHRLHKKIMRKVKDDFKNGSDAKEKED